MRRETNKGFTLIELLVVIGIIGMLATIVLAGVTRARTRSRDARRVADMRTIETALELFFSDHGRYPGPTVEGISNSGEMIGDDNGSIEQALTPYFSVVPKDPRHNGSTHYYAYDPQHCTDNPIGSCNCMGPSGAVLAFRTAESDSVPLRKDTCSGNELDIDASAFNIVMTPAGE